MARFIHLSDLHIHTRGKRKENKNLVALRDFLIQHYAYAQERPIVCITGDLVHGDITQATFDTQYIQAVELLRPLVKTFKVLVAPGNHDYAKNGLEFYRPSYDFFNKHVLGGLLGIEGTNAADPDDNPMYPMTHVTPDGVLFIILDSAIGNHTHSGRFARGKLGARQRDLLRDMLNTNKAQGRPVVVMFHHHPFLRLDVTMLMDDGRGVMRILHGKTDVLCFGHKHHSYEKYNDKGIGLVLQSRKSTKLYRGMLRFREVTVAPGTVRAQTLSVPI